MSGKEPGTTILTSCREWIFSASEGKGIVTFMAILAQTQPKHMLRILLTLSFAFFVSLLKAQSSYVEVTAEDTIHVIPQEIIYQVSQFNGESIDSTTIVTTTTSTFNNTIVQSPVSDPMPTVRRLVSSMRLDTVVKRDYTVSGGASLDKLSEIRLRFISFAQLDAFIKELRKIKDVNGSIISIQHKSTDKETKILLQKLFFKAKEKAQMLALIAQKKLGNVISIKDQPVNAGWTMYPPLSALRSQWSPILIDEIQNEYIVIQCSLIVQFGWQ